MTLQNRQLEICKKFQAEFVAASKDSMVGVADNLGKKLPVNGLRHPMEGNTVGWYLWSGEKFPEGDADFKPMHVSHLAQLRPEVLPYLGLAPGWRFLINPKTNYEDVWFDQKLLKI